MTAARSKRTWTWRSTSPTTARSKQRRAEARARGKLRGIGISNTIERAGSEGNEAVEINFDRSGTVTIGSGSLNQGQGHETMYKQLAAAYLGLDPAEMRYIQGDSDKVPDGRGSFGSRSATIGGTAMNMAAGKDRRQGEPHRREDAGVRPRGRRLRGRHLQQQGEQPHADAEGDRPSLA